MFIYRIDHGISSTETNQTGSDELYMQVHEVTSDNEEEMEVKHQSTYVNRRLWIDKLPSIQDIFKKYPRFRDMPKKTVIKHSEFDLCNIYVSCYVDKIWFWEAVPDRDRDICYSMGLGWNGTNKKTKREQIRLPQTTGRKRFGYSLTYTLPFLIQFDFTLAAASKNRRTKEILNCLPALFPVRVKSDGKSRITGSGTPCHCTSLYLDFPVIDSDSVAV